MDAFYASVEQLDNPALRGQPVLVGPLSGRGVVLTASYEARPYQVGSAMPMAIARKRCPDGVVVPPRFERYRELSAAVMNVFRDFSPQVEAISLDEAFLDMTGCEHIFGTPQQLGTQLKQAIEAATGGLKASVGISNSKFIAKVASGYRKPDGLTIVPPAVTREWLAPQSVKVLWGAGPKTQRKLAQLQLDTVGDIAAADPGWLEAKLGKTGLRFHALARGDDHRPVQSGRPAKSLSSERTLNHDTADLNLIRMHLRKAAETVAQRLRKASLEAGGIRVKMRRADFGIVSSQRRLTQPTATTQVICDAAEALTESLLVHGPFRLIGIGVYDLEVPDTTRQLDFGIGDNERGNRLDRVLDQVAVRFGPGVVRRARQLDGETVLDESSDLDFLNQDYYARGERH
jgi:DNA polymerase-4